MDMSKLTVTPAESEHACQLFAEVAGTLKNAKIGSQVIQFRSLPRGHRRRKMLGNRLVVRYRSDTGDKGPIQEGKFRDWLKQWIADHQGVINFARLIVSILTLLIMI
jgi:hypothetical protein